MKLSSYNFFVEQPNIVICYNTISDNFLAISHSAYQQVLACKENIDLLRQSNTKIFNQLHDNGFVVDSELDELSYLRFRNKRECFSQEYDITIIPTLDCNLKCWYCWEKHIENSIMSEEIQEAIVKHVKNELIQGRINQLNIEWFGGEPFLAFDKVVNPLGTKLVNLAHEYKIPFASTFITNATLINPSMIDKLNEFNSYFQITIDGHREKHNKVKTYKSTSGDAYCRVIENLHLLTDKLPNTIGLRINFDDNTLNKFDEILDDIKDIDKNKISIYFERVWQTKSLGNNGKLKDALIKASMLGFKTEYGNFNTRSYCCKSDRYSQIGFNYDGKIYKCTGRPFIDENSDGEILPNGDIILREDKIFKRTGLSTFENKKCLECKMLPQCAGPCSSKCIENNWQNIEELCALKGMEMTMDEYIVFMFANRYQLQKHQNAVHNE